MVNRDNKHGHMQQEVRSVQVTEFTKCKMCCVPQVLTEAYRVLRPGGRFMCLEFSEVTNPLLRRCVTQPSTANH